MKICPACATTYNDDSMRFCTKDGTPLVSYDEPIITPPAVSTPPAQSASFGETMSDLSAFTPPPPEQSQEPQIIEEPDDEPQTQISPSERFTVSVNESHPAQQQQQVPPVIPPPVSAQQLPSPVQAQPAKKKSNTAIFAVLGALLVLGLLGLAAVGGAYWYMTSRSNEVAVNTNSNADANTNAAPSNDNSTDVTSNQPPFDVNANTSDNTNENINLNLNANTRPSPSPRTSPSPSPSPRGNANRNEEQPATDEPPPTPTPAVRPTPAPTQQGTRTIGGGVVNGRATSLPKPSYPANARSVRAEGQVNVQVMIDENGSVVSANAITGHALLRPAATSAARQAKFSPTVVNGQPVRVSGVIVYNFILNQ